MVPVSDNCNEKVISRMKEAIERRRNPNGTVSKFSRAIDATKVSGVLEVSQGHKLIFGGEFPSHIIDMAELQKEGVRGILDGKSAQYGEIKLATEI